MTTPLLMVKAGSRSSLSLCIPIVMLRPSHSAVVKETMIAARVVRARLSHTRYVRRKPPRAKMPLDLSQVKTASWPHLVHRKMPLLYLCRVECLVL